MEKMRSTLKIQIIFAIILAICSFLMLCIETFLMLGVGLGYIKSKPIGYTILTINTILLPFIKLFGEGFHLLIVIPISWGVIGFLLGYPIAKVVNRRYRKEM